MYEENQIGLPGSDQLWKQQLKESGLETHWVTAVATIAGGIFGAIGQNQRARANQKNADRQAKHAKEMAKWEWKETKRRESYAQYELDLARLNEENLRNLTDSMALDKYNRELYIRDYNYKSQVAAYNASEAQYARQLDYNMMGAKLAREEQRLWLEEQQRMLQFQYEEIAYAEAKARDGFDLTRESLTLEHRSKRAEASIKSLEGWLKGLDANAKVRVMGQSGRTRRKNLQSVAMSASMQQAFLNDAVTKSDQAFDVKQRQNYNAYIESRRDAALAKRKTAASWESAVKQNQAKLLRIEYDQYGADMAADSRRMARPGRYEDLPPIPAPYNTPKTHIPDIYKSTKPPGPMGAPNLTAGTGMMMAGSIMGSIGKAAAAYNPSTPNSTPGGGVGQRTQTGISGWAGGYSGVGY